VRIAVRRTPADRSSAIVESTIAGGPETREQPPSSVRDFLPDHFGADASAPARPSGQHARRISHGRHDLQADLPLRFRDDVAEHELILSAGRVDQHDITLLAAI